MSAPSVPRATPRFLRALAETESADTHKIVFVGTSAYPVAVPREATPAPCMPLLIPQQAFNLALRKVLPEEYTRGLHFPCVEDILNSTPLCEFWAFLAESTQIDEVRSTFAGHRQPHKFSRAHNEDRQKGAAYVNEEIRPIFGYGHDADSQFSAVQSICSSPYLPWNYPADANAELRFAAAISVATTDLPGHRRQIQAALQELSDRCRGLTDRLRSHQPPTVRRVAGNVNLGLMAVLSTFTCWPGLQVRREVDHRIPHSRQHGPYSRLPPPAGPGAARRGRAAQNGRAGAR